MKTIEFDSLIGKHLLSGVDLYNDRIKEEYGSGYEDCSCISFVLDGITYTAIEDPDDGYRSSMKELGISDYKVKNTFPSVEVVIREKPDDKYGDKHDALEFIDIINGEVILTVGTKNVEDYYPSFVSDFVPEKMSINAKVKESPQ